MIKMIFIVLLGILIVIGGAATISAADSVNLVANVVPRKSTDTMNDFDFSNLGSNMSAEGQVKGAQTGNYSAGGLDILLISFSLVGAFILSFLIAISLKKRRNFWANANFQNI